MPGNPKRRKNKQAITDSRNHKQFTRAEAQYQEAFEREFSAPLPVRTLSQRLHMKFISFRPVVWVRKLLFILEQRRHMI